MSISRIFLIEIVKNRHTGVFMLTIKRHEKILSIIQERKTITSKELQKLVYVSHSTIIRDLTELEKMGLIKRIHGGASIVVPKDIESSFNIRVKTNVNEKTLITKAASRFIEDGNTIFIDSSSTLQTLITHLKNFKYLNVITNGMNSAMLLSKNTDANIFFLGGQISANSNSSMGCLALNNLDNFNADIAIFSTSGISGNIICEHSIEQAAIKKAMIKRANISVLLCDSSKFGIKHQIAFANFNDVDYFITNEMPTSDILKAIDESKCKLIIAE